ncbi:MAG: hypothetical protein EH225_06250 [Calditrichaeota bacterium]|nr:MAG: hypothetical protein EH225_06250 [Calditrichota bacterium]
MDDESEIFHNGFFQFNITALIQYIKENPNDFPVEKISTGFYPVEFSSINENHMESVVLGEPVILGEISPGRFNLIDGNHRMEKARRFGLDTIEAYRIDSIRLREFITTDRAYWSYVEYWNDKMDQAESK